MPDLETSVFWFAAVVFFLVMEGLAPALICIWFAFGAFVAGVSSLFVGSLAVQILIFVMASLIFLVITWPFARNYINNHVKKTNLDSLIGKSLVVQIAVIPQTGSGRGMIEGKDWALKSADGSMIAAGEVVQVIAIEGVKLVVQRMIG